MNPLTIFLSLVAIAGGLFVVGLAVIALVLLWAAIRGAAENSR